MSESNIRIIARTPLSNAIRARIVDAERRKICAVEKIAELNSKLSFKIKVRAGEDRT